MREHLRYVVNGGSDAGVAYLDWTPPGSAPWPPSTTCLGIACGRLAVTRGASSVRVVAARCASLAMQWLLAPLRLSR